VTWELAQHFGQYGLEPCFANLRHRADHLPLCNFVDRVDVIDPLYSFQIAYPGRPSGSGLRRFPIATRVGLVD